MCSFYKVEGILLCFQNLQFNSWNFLDKYGRSRKHVLPFEQFQFSRIIARMEIEQYVEYFMSGVSTSLICFQHLL